MFTLSRSPTGVAFLDDDSDFLETLALLLPRDRRMEFHLRPAPLQARLQADAARWAAEIDWRGRTVTRWREGAALPAQILQYWQNNARFERLGVCVVDYSMPVMTGLEFLSQTGDWPGARILLTGRADEQIAVQAFNGGLIEQFIPKRDNGSIERLNASIAALSDAVQNRIANPWRETLLPEQLRQLNRLGVAAELERRIAERGWVEYVTLGEPFGVLGMDGAGVVGWLQLEAAGDLAVAADLARSEGWEAVLIGQLQRGERLTDLELCVGLDQPQTAQLRLPFALGEGLLGAFFELPEFNLSGGSYGVFLAAQPARRLQR